MATILPYATVADMVLRFSKRELVELTDHDNIPPTTMDDEAVQKALDDAVAFADGYIGVVYKLPLLGCLKPVVPGGSREYVAPPRLTILVCDIARYHLYDDVAPEHEVYRRYVAAKQALEDLAAGKWLLACPWGGAPGETIADDPLNPGGQTDYSFSPRRVTDDTVKGYR